MNKGPNLGVQMAKALSLVHELAGDGIVNHGQYDQYGIGAQTARFGHLPGVDQKVLADAGQGDGGAGRDQIGVIALKAGLIGQDRQTGRPPRLIGLC